MRLMTSVLFAALFSAGVFSQDERSPGGDPPDSSAPPPLEKNPELTSFVKAAYPPDLVKKGVAGTVVLDLLVNEKGMVDSVAVVSGVHPRLDSAAAKAARAFVFSPAVADSQPVAVMLQYAYRFTIDEIVKKIEEYVNLKGRLYERGTRSPLAHATVAATFADTACDASLSVPWGAYLDKIGGFDGQYLQEGSIITTADSTGYFQFKSLPVCTLEIKVLAPDFQHFADRVALRPGEATELVYRLERTSIGDNEIVVYGKRERKEVAQRTLTLNEVRKIPGLGGDAVKVVQALPGVARTAFNLGGLVIRGSGQGDSRFFLDGVRLPALFHFGGLTSVYNSTALESIDLYPGGFGARYGGALGGVVEIKGRKSKVDRYHGYLDANFLDASFLVEGPITPTTSFLLSARRSYIADMLSFTLDNVLGVQLPFTVVPYYWDYLARVDAEPLKNQHFYVTLFGAKDAMDLITNEARGGSAQISEEKNRASMDQYFHMGIAGWDWDISKRWRNELRYSLEYDKSEFSMFGFVEVNGDGLNHYIRDQLAFSQRDDLTWNLGADMDIYPYDLRLTTPGVNGTIERDTSHYVFGPIGAYLSAEWKPIPRLRLIPGVRFDYYPELIYDGSVVPEFWNYRSFRNGRGISGEPSIRLTARYDVSDGHTVKGSLGTYNQTPQPMGQAIDKTWGEPDLPAEKGSQYVAGYEWRINDLVSADVQAYFNRQWDNARFPNEKDVAIDPDRKFYGNGKGRMAGLELLLKHDQGKRFFGWLSYSLSRSERWNYKTNVWSLFSQDQTHYVQLIGNYRITPTHETGLRFRYVTGDPTTPILGVDYYDATNRVYVPKYGPYNSARVQGYLALDLRYEKKFVYQTWLWSMYLDVTHVENMFTYGYKSPEFGGYQWNYDFSEKRVFADVTRPALGLKVEF